MAIIGGPTKYCRWCGSAFTATVRHRVYCSAVCMQAAKKDGRYKDTQGRPGKLLQPEVRICKTCGKPFVTDHEGRKYCSDKCRFYPDDVKAEMEKINGNMQEMLSKGELL